MATTELLIDGDQFLYRSTVSCEKEVKWDEENWVLHSNEEEAFETCERMISNEVERIRKHLDIFDIPLDCQHLFFSAGESFRHQVYEGYKGNRKGARKPMCYWQTKDRIRKHYPVCFEIDTLEADDLMGIYSSSPNYNRWRNKRIIVSADKDMKTIPGFLWDGSKVVEISKDEADFWFFYQTLVGDVTDGYPGCPGIGDVKARKLLEKDCSWDTIIDAYEAAKLTEEHALVQARCARILRGTDFSEGELLHAKLWSPYEA